MGYSTDFEGGIFFDKELHPKLKKFLDKLSTTRRMKSNKMKSLYGIEGEFFVNGKGAFGQETTPEVIDQNSPPSTQPSLWCQWMPTDDGMGIEWDGGEKFYYYVEWLEYIINKITKPNGYVANGEITWQGEERQDKGRIIVRDNVITTEEIEVD